MVKLFSETNLSPRLETLRSVSLFADLKAKELRIVDGLLHERSYVADEVVFDEGEDGQALYVEFSGEVLIVHPTDGGDGLVATVKSGEFFGDMALIDKWPRAAQARAAAPTVVGVLFRSDFQTLMETHARIASRIALQLAREMGQRLRQRVDAAAHGRGKL